MTPRRMFKPSKNTVLERWAFNLGPQRTVLDMLSHLGDDAIFRPFDPGEEPTWVEALAMLVVHNPQFSVEDVAASLTRRVPAIRTLPIRRKRQ